MANPPDDPKNPAPTVRGYLRVASRAVKRGRKLRPSILPGAPRNASEDGDASAGLTSGENDADRDDEESDDEQGGDAENDAASEAENDAESEAENESGASPAPPVHVFAGHARTPMTSAALRSTQPAESGAPAIVRGHLTIITSEPGTDFADPDLEYEDLDLQRISQLSRPSLAPLLFDRAAQKKLPPPPDEQHPNVSRAPFEEKTLVSTEHGSDGGRREMAAAIAILEAAGPTSAGAPMSAQPSSAQPSSAQPSSASAASLRRTLAGLERKPAVPPRALMLFGVGAITAAFLGVRALATNDEQPAGRAAIEPRVAPANAIAAAARTAAVSVATGTASAAPAGGGVLDSAPGASAEAVASAVSEEGAPTADASAAVNDPLAATSGEAISEDYAVVLAKTREFLTDGKHKEAEAWARKLVALRPADAFGYRCLGASLQDQGRPREALAVYSECVTHAKVGDAVECARLGGVRKK
ncbi:MAG: hypothetical protein EXR75_01090 [Myxococcales bacterium]|nr:hypothetical protein [Myxococcales bacterium]